MEDSLEILIDISFSLYIADKFSGKIVNFRFFPNNNLDGFEEIKERKLLFALGADEVKCDSHKFNKISDTAYVNKDLGIIRQLKYKLID